MSAVLAFLSGLGSNITSVTWWKAALIRAVYTAVEVAVPYLLGVTVLTAVPWPTVGSVAVLAFVASLVTSLGGVPEASGTNVPWWLSATERTAKTFFQSVASGLVGATLLSDVAWRSVLDAALLSAGIALLRLILATLPTTSASTLAVSATGVVSTVTIAAETTAETTTAATPVETAEADTAPTAAQGTGDTPDVEATQVSVSASLPSLDWTRADLAAYAVSMGLTVTSKATKADILSAITTALTQTGD